MNISFTFKNFEPSDHLRKYATRRFNKLARFVPKGKEASLSVILTVDKFRHKAEVLLTADGQKFSAMEQTDDMYSTVDLILDKVEAQVKRHGEKSLEHRREAVRQKGKEQDIPRFRAQTKGAETVLVLDDRIEHKPLYHEDAVLYLENNNQDLIVFLNAETEKINVMYRHTDGRISLIDPDEHDAL